MGADIESAVEIRGADGKWRLMEECVFPDIDTYSRDLLPGPFSARSYRVFGFIGDVRNRSHIPSPWARRGLPADASEEVLRMFTGEDCEMFGHSHITAAELAAFDYDQTFEDHDHGARLTTFRDALGKRFFVDLEILKGISTDLTAVRVVFGFDN